MTKKTYLLIYKSRFDGEVVEMPFPDKYEAEVARDNLFNDEGITATIVEDKDPLPPL